MSNITITTECVADLPRKLVKKESIGIIYYDVETEKGLFRDTEEIDAQNIMEYMGEARSMARGVVPSANDYRNFFKKKLEEYDEIVHVCATSVVTDAVKNAMHGRLKLGVDGHKIHIVDSRQLSGGLGLLVFEAAKCRNQGMSSKEIVEHVTQKIPLIKMSFLSTNADYLFYNQKVSKNIMKLCNLFHLHPVLKMDEGNLVLARVYIGNYEKATSKYIADVLQEVENIDSNIGMLIYAGCGHDMLQRVKREISKKVLFDELWEQQASATVSSNCGPLSFGVIYETKEG